MNYEEAFLSTIQSAIQHAFHELLSTKHLYQHVRVSEETIGKKTKQLHDEAVRKASIPQIGSFPPRPRGGAPTLEQIALSGTRLLNLTWNLIIPEPRLKSKMEFPGGCDATINAIDVDLPTIRTTCAGTCKKDEPFNPIRCDLPTTHGRYFNYSPSEQVFVLQYQCQACKGRPITFLVHRNKDKLTICGRDPIELVTIPSEIPKKHHKHFSSAIIAHQSGQHLPAIFMLRVFIEQYWLSFPSIQAAITTTRYSGDILGDEYKKLLPEDFKLRFPTLLETYGKLSSAIHTADENEKIFMEEKAKILKHFEALRTFEIDLSNIQSEVGVSQEKEQSEQTSEAKPWFQYG